MSISKELDFNLDLEISLLPFSFKNGRRLLWISLRGFEERGGVWILDDFEQGKKGGVVTKKKISDVLKLVCRDTQGFCGNV